MKRLVLCLPLIRFFLKRLTLSASVDCAVDPIRLQQHNAAGAAGNTGRVRSRTGCSVRVSISDRNNGRHLSRGGLAGFVDGNSSATHDRDTFPSLLKSSDRNLLPR